MKKIIPIFMSLSFVLVAFSSCSCSTGEEYASKLYDVDVDMDGDGDAGDRGGEYNKISFKGSQTGYTGKCKLCECTGGDRTATGKCSNCEHSRTKHRWHN